MDNSCYLCIVSVMLSGLFIVALRSHAGKGLTFRTFVHVRNFYCCSVSFPCGVLGQVSYLIVSITDLYLLPYFVNCVL